MNSHESRIRHVASNFKWSAINAAVTSILPFVIRTLIIHQIGLEYSGVSSLFSSVLQVLNIADFGIESAVTFYLYKPLAERDFDSVSYLIRLVRKTYFIIGLIILAAGLALIPVIPYLVKDKAYPEGLNLYYVYIIYIINSAWAYLTTGYKSTLLRADQHLDSVSKAGIISGGLMYIVQIISLIITANYYIYCAELLIGSALNSVMMNYYADRRYRRYLDSAEPKKSLLMGSRDFISGLKSRMVLIGLGKLRNISRNSFDSIVISSFIGLTVLAKYQNYYQIMMVPVTLLAIVHSSMAPSFGNSVATENIENNYNVLKTYSFVICGFSCISISCLLNLYQPFMILWMGTEYLMPYRLVVLFAVYFYMLCVCDINEVLKETTGIWKQERYVAVAEAAGNFLLNLVLVQHYGVDGVLAATILTLSFINIPFEFNYLFRHYYQHHGFRFFLLELKYAVTCLGLSCISYVVCSRINMNGIAGILVRLMVSCAIPTLLFVIIYRKDEEMMNLRRMAKILRKS